MSNIKKKLTIEGHRGYRPLENSLEGFTKCLEMNLNGVETDLWMLKDGNIVLHHGHTPLGLIELKNLKTNEIHKIYVKTMIKEDLENYVDLHTNKKLILLEDFLEVFKQKPEIYLNLEVKDCRYEAVKAILQVLTDFKPPNRIYMSSFYHSVKNYLKKLQPEFKIVDDISFGFLAYHLDALERINPFFGIALVSYKHPIIKN
jgi:glycerophosphoryl diester phosphodiesterase